MDHFPQLVGYLSKKKANIWDGPLQMQSPQLTTPSFPATPVACQFLSHLSPPHLYTGYDPSTSLVSTWNSSSWFPSTDVSWLAEFPQYICLIVHQMALKQFCQMGNLSPITFTNTSSPSLPFSEIHTFFNFPNNNAVLLLWNINCVSFSTDVAWHIEYFQYYFLFHFSCTYDFVLLFMRIKYYTSIWKQGTAETGLYKKRQSSVNQAA